MSPADAAALGVVDGERGAGHVPAGFGGRPGPGRSRAAARPRVHDPALPGRGGHQPAHHRGHRPQVGHRRVQGGGGTGGDRAAEVRRGWPLESDLRFRGETPSPAEVAALDALLGPRRGRRRRGAPPAAARPPRRSRRDRLDQPRRPGRDLPAPRGGPGRGVRGGVLLRPFSMEPGRRRVVHVCVDLACRMAGSGDLVAGLPAHGAPPDRGRRAPAWGCASGPRRPWW